MEGRKKIRPAATFAMVAVDALLLLIFMAALLPTHLKIMVAGYLSTILFFNSLYLLRSRRITQSSPAKVGAGARFLYICAGALIAWTLYELYTSLQGELQYTLTFLPLLLFPLLLAVCCLRMARPGAIRRKLLIVSMAALALVIGLLCAEYRRYAYAVAWHCVHGNYAQVAGHRIRLPILWWEENDSDHYDTSLLLRACPASTLFNPKIDVSPTLPRENFATDQEALEATQRIIRILSLSNHNSVYKGPTSRVLKNPVSLVILSSKPFTLYCEREAFVVLGVDIHSSLLCQSARVPYSFSYYGPPARQKEAEFILSTFE